MANVVSAEKISYVTNQKSTAKIEKSVKCLKVDGPKSESNGKHLGNMPHVHL